MPCVMSRAIAQALHTRRNSGNDRHHVERPEMHPAIHDVVDGKQTQIHHNRNVAPRLWQHLDYVKQMD
jgi:hypothetical protein